MKKAIFGAAIAVIFVLIGLGIARLDYIGKIGSSYKSRFTCNEVFTAGRQLDDVIETEYSELPEEAELLKIDVDDENKEVSVGLGPLARKKSVYREGYGCTHITGKLVDVPPLRPVEPEAWDTAKPSEYGIDGKALDNALDEVFAMKADKHRAIVVIKNGHLIAERYAPGFDRNTRMYSYSMAKTVTQMMVGAAINLGLFDLDDRASIEEWSASDDPRREITWRHLLQMQSGLDFSEDYNDYDEFNKYQEMSHSMAQYAIAKPLVHEPGTHWAYMTYTSQVLQRALRVALENNGIDYHSFARDKIFEPLGASSVVFIPDSSGEFIGGSSVYATARDWAKLGQLFLEGGVWNGERIFPEFWSEFVTTPASASGGVYSAQMWLNNYSTKHKWQYFPPLPVNTYLFAGAGAQHVLILPDDDMIIIRLGRGYFDHREREPVIRALEVVVPVLNLKEEKSRGS
ncbi:MAG: serine hydrolase [Pseudomonadota bacterium]